MSCHPFDTAKSDEDCQPPKVLVPASVAECSGLRMMVLFTKRNCNLYTNLYLTKALHAGRLSYAPEARPGLSSYWLTS